MFKREFLKDVLQRYDKQFSYVTVANYIVMSLQFAIIWVHPGSLENIKTYGAIMALEIVMVHSGIFMFLLAKLRFTIPIFILLYGLFAYGINKTLPDNTIIINYMVLMIYRMRIIFYSKSKELFKHFEYSFLIAVLCVILFNFIAISQEYIPRFGITDSFISASDSGWESSSSESTKVVFNSAPHVIIVIGTLYFAMLAYIEYRILKKGLQEAVEMQSVIPKKRSKKRKVLKRKLSRKMDEAYSETAVNRVDSPVSDK